MKKRSAFLYAVCYLAYTAIYIARLNLSAASPALKAAGMTSAQLGLLGSAFSVVYALGRLLNGVRSDRTQPWVMISSGLLLTGVSNLLVSVLPPFSGILLLWCANAFAQSMLWSSVLYVVSAIYDPETARAKNAFISTSSSVGNILGVLVNLYLIERAGLRWAFIFPGALTLLLGAVTLAALKPIRISAVARDKDWLDMFHLLRDRDLRNILWPTACHGMLRDNVTLWMTVFFVERFGVNLDESFAFLFFIPAVGFLGRTVYPVLYRLCGEGECRMAQYAFVLSGLVSALLCLGGLRPAGAMLCLGTVYAAACVANVSFLAIYPTRYIGSGSMASVCGLLDFITYLGSGTASLAYGLILDRYGYTPMFASWAALSLLSLLVLRR